MNTNALFPKGDDAKSGTVTCSTQEASGFQFGGEIERVLNGFGGFPGLVHF